MKMVREQMRGSGGVFSGAHMMGFYPCWLRQSLGKGLVGFAFTVLCMISRWIFMSLAVTSRISTKRGFDIMLIVNFARFLTHRKGARKIQLEHQMQHVLNINSFKTPLWDALQVHSNPADPSSTIYHWRLRAGNVGIFKENMSCSPVLVLSQGRFEHFYYLLSKLTRNNILFVYDEPLPLIFSAFIDARGKKSLRCSTNRVVNQFYSLFTEMIGKRIQRSF